jgi:hypothetical protein
MRDNPGDTKQVPVPEFNECPRIHKITRKCRRVLFYFCSIAQAGALPRLTVRVIVDTKVLHAIIMVSKILNQTGGFIYYGFVSADTGCC